jgi:23S rRNA (cytosine1962-C5)-methyltransferase
MAPSAAALERALAAYRRVNELALRRVAKGGLLLTASCSSHVSEAHLVEVVRDAARAANRPTRILEHRGAGPDHPVLPAFPEGRYLSALLVFVE